MMNGDNLAKRGVTLMRVWHDLALTMFVSPVRWPGCSRMLFLVMSGMGVRRPGGHLGVMVMGRAGGGRRGGRWMMVMMDTGLGGRSNQGEQRDRGARDECGPDDGCHGSFPISATL